MQDDEGQITEAHSVSAGLDYPGSGPEHAWLRDTRPRALRGGRRRAGAGRLPPRHAPGGDHPGARDRPRAALRARSRTRATLDLVCLSGRGDKDLAEVLADAAPARREPPAPVSDGAERIAAAFAGARGRAPRRAHALPDGRLPRPRAARARSARPTPTAAPTSSSWASRSPTRWPTGRSSTRRGPAALAAGATVDGVLDVGERARARGCRSWSCATPTSSWPAAPRPSPQRCADAGASGLIVPDLPLEEAPAVLAACDAAGVALVPLVAPTTPDERLARDRRARARLPLHRLGHRDDRRARGAGGRASRDVVARAQRQHRASRSRWASASPRPSRPPRPPPRAPTASSSAAASSARRPRPTTRPPPCASSSPASPPDSRRASVESAPRMGLAVATTTGLVDLDRPLVARHQGDRRVPDHDRSSSWSRRRRRSLARYLPGNGRRSLTRFAA